MRKDHIPTLHKFFDSDYISLKLFIEKEGINTKFNDYEFEQYDLQKQDVDRIKSQQQDTINQHYVQQFYLKKFINRQGRLETADIKNKKIIKSQSPKKICSQEYFYSIFPGTGDIVSQVVEEYLEKEFENPFVEIYDDLIGLINSSNPIDNRTIYILCRYVIMSMFRVGKFKEMQEESKKESMKRVLKSNSELYDQIIELYGSDSESVIDEMIQEKMRVNDLHLKWITDPEIINQFVNLLFRKKIRIYVSDGEYSFVTSDNPVTEFQPEIQGIYGYTFFQRTHYFPLGPKVLIEFISPKIPGKRVKRKRIGGDQVMYFNLIKSMSSSFLYSESKLNLSPDIYQQTIYKNIDKLYELMPTLFFPYKRFMNSSL